METQNTNVPKGHLGPHLVPEFSLWDYLVERGHRTSQTEELRDLTLGQSSIVVQPAPGCDYVHFTFFTFVLLVTV